MPALTVAELALLCQGTAQGEVDRVIVGANSLEAASSSDLSFVGSDKAKDAAALSRAGCLFVSESFELQGDWALIQVRDPRSAFARALAKLYPATRPEPSIHPSAVIATSAHVAGDCSIGAYTVIGEDVDIASGCRIADGVHIGEHVTIGTGATIYPHVTLYPGVTIGARAILHAGCVIGADGFGFAFADGRYEKFPQVGTVRIDNDVEIGANCCIDRAALGVTSIGAGTKLDNMVHVAHNCSIGKHVVIAAQTGFAGGVVVEDYAVIGGQVGVGEKAKIASKAIVGSGAGILSFQQVRAGEPVWGTPARPLRQYLKGLANVNKIAAIKTALRSLETQVARLSEQ